MTAEPDYLHEMRFPGESKEYRQARDALLHAEKDVRDRTDAVAEQRRRLWNILDCTPEGRPKENTPRPAVPMTRRAATRRGPGELAANPRLRVLRLGPGPDGGSRRSDGQQVGSLVERVANVPLDPVPANLLVV
jgi:hypothetical protein